MKNESEIVDLLLTKEAKITIRNNHDKTPQDVTNELQNNIIAKNLQEYSRLEPGPSNHQRAQPLKQQLLRKRTRSDSSGNVQEDNNSNKLRTPSSDDQPMEVEEFELQSPSYNREATGLLTSYHGIVYQVQWMMVVALEAKKHNIISGFTFKTEVQNEDAGKFDDVVWQYKSNQQKKYSFLQAKHKLNVADTITIKDLLKPKQKDLVKCDKTDKRPFALEKYFISYRDKIKTNSKYQDGQIESLIICTNIDLDENLKKNCFAEPKNRITVLEDINDCDIQSKKSKYWRIKESYSFNKEKIKQMLEGTYDLIKLARKLGEYLLDEQPILLTDDLKPYNQALYNGIIEGNKFCDNFINGNGLSEQGRYLREAFFQEAFKNKRKILDLSNNEISKPEEFAQEIISLIEQSKKKDQKIVKIERKKNIIKKNIDKLAGYTLIEKDGAIKFNPKFWTASDNELPNHSLNIFRNTLKKQQLMIDNLKGLKFKIANFKTCKAILVDENSFWDGVKDFNKFTDFISDAVSSKNLPNYSLHDIKDDIDDFFDKLVFAVSYSKERLSKLIEHELGDSFGLIDNDYVAHAFRVEIAKALDLTEKKFISTAKEVLQFFEQAQQNISKLVLIGPTLEYHAKIKAFGIAFTEEPTGLRSFLMSNDKQIFNLISPHRTMLSSIKVYQTLKNIPQYQKDDSHIFMRLTSLLHMQDRIIQTFSSKTSSLLVIECKTTERDTEKLYNQLSKIIQSNRNKKVILITHENDTLAEKFKNNFSKNNKYEKQEDKKNSLIDLTNKSQEKLLEEGKVTFQGKEVNLGILMNNNSKHLIDGKILCSLIDNEKVEIGKAPSDLGDVEYYYIDRVFYRQVKVKDKFLKARDIPDLFAISNIEQNELYELVNKEDSKKTDEQQKVRRFVDNDPNRNNPIRFIVLDSENAEEDFKQLSHDYSSHNIHWLKKAGYEFIWQQSYGASLSNLRKYLDNQNKTNIEVEESEFIKLISSDDDNKVIIISAEPGMGKSTLMTNLAKAFKECILSRWVIKVNLFDSVKQLNELDLKKNNAIEFLVNVLNLNDNILSESLFLYRMREQGEIILLLDGFDEISPNYKEKTINLLKSLKETQINQILVSTRGYVQDVLEDAFTTLSYNLKPFSLEDHENFLRKFWQRKLCLNSIDELKFKKYFYKLLEFFTGVPLLIEMLAENHEKKFKDFCDSRKSELSNYQSQEKFDLLTLYEDFIEKKHNRYHLDKLGKRKENPGITEEIKELKEQFIKNHKLFAMQRLFSEDQLKLLLTEEERKQIQELMKRIGSGKEKTGIVNKVIGDKPDFIHLSFAEYFAAELISDKLKSMYSTQLVWDFLVNTIFTGDHQNIRKFFNNKLASDPELANLSSNNGKALVDLLLEQDSERPLFVAVKESLVEIIDFLLKSAKEDLDSLIKIINIQGKEGLPLCLAIENDHKEVVETLLKYVKAKNNNRLIEIINVTDFNYNSPLFLAIQDENNEIVDILLKDIKDNNQIVDIILKPVNYDGHNLIDLAAAEEITLNSLNKYIVCLNSDQQETLFSDLSNLGFENFDFILDLHSFLKKNIFYKVCQNNMEEIREALGQDRFGRESPEQHPEWFRIKALMEQDENEMDYDFYQ